VAPRVRPGEEMGRREREPWLDHVFSRPGAYAMGLAGAGASTIPPIGRTCNCAADPATRDSLGPGLVLGRDAARVCILAFLKANDTRSAG